MCVWVGKIGVNRSDRENSSGQNQQSIGSLDLYIVKEGRAVLSFRVIGRKSASFLARLKNSASSAIVQPRMSVRRTYEGMLGISLVLTR